MTSENIVQNKKYRVNLSYQEMEIDYYRYLFVKAYLYTLFIEKIQHPLLKVVRMIGRNGSTFLRPSPVSISDRSDQNFLFVLDECIESTVRFEDHSYEIVLQRILDSSDRSRFFLGTLGLEIDANNTDTLLKLIIKEALRHSSYRNKFLVAKPIEKRGQTDVDIEIKELEQTSLEDIFLPEQTKEQLSFFVDCLKNHSPHLQSLRVLLSGKPGTAKTKIIRAIANEAKGQATFIFANGSDNTIDAIFSLAENFSPVVICIDDVDLLVGARENKDPRPALGKFLQHLDGFIGSGIFLLATTNDKSFVDTAASRPGRFDMILDVNPIEAKHYLQLVKSKTKVNEIIELFDERILDVLEARKVTGAFVSTAVKHLELARHIGKQIPDSIYLLNLIDRMNTGFYKDPQKSGERFGFYNETYS